MANVASGSHAGRMTSSAPSVRKAVFTAAAVSLAITLLRFFGEREGWDPRFFSRQPGGGGALLGITWLVLPFGFWFGRRLAKNGKRPATTGKALLLHLIGIALVAGVFFVGFKVTDDWRVRGYINNAGAVAAGLLALVAWRSAWFTLVCYGVLARIPVLVVQYFSVTNGWDNHFAKGPPGAEPGDVLFLLTMAQSFFWPFGFTTLVGGIFAILGAASVRR